MAKRGRPTYSKVRQNVVEILYFMKQGYGYEIYKVYKELFPAVTLRVIYYHLRKGQQLGEFEVAEVKKTKGNYSWGGEAEKIYYKLGPKAKPRMDDTVKAFFEK
ncbi:MAG: hypothetical protein OXR66_02855 [Candidatus Woesearchaeota archaeon]|nr:hypothetical protein [Candidatus Woesearchaeota archaeon]